MASTNKTTNYNLSQFIGSDKPTYLGDYNSDMLKIDAQMKTNADNVATAISGIETATATANSANQTAQSANTTANSANQTAQTANTNANNAQSTANSALATATTASGKADQVESNLNTFENNFNFTSITSYSSASDFNINYATLSTSNLRVVCNSDGSIGKIYGKIKLNSDNSHAPSLTFSSNLRPTSNITIHCVGMTYHCFTGQDYVPGNTVDLEIATNGTVTINTNYAGSRNLTVLFIYPSLLFMKDFGDTPTPDDN